jgi:hypothetical protein
MFQLVNSLRTEVFWEKFRKCISLPEFIRNWIEKWLNWNGAIRKCSSRSFQWLVMSVFFNNLKLFGQFLCPPLAVTEVAISPELNWMLLEFSECCMNVWNSRTKIHSQWKVFMWSSRVEFFKLLFWEHHSTIFSLHDQVYPWTAIYAISGVQYPKYS